METMLLPARRRRLVRGVAGLAVLAAVLLAMLHFTTVAVEGDTASRLAEKKAPPEGGAPTRAVGERRFVTSSTEGKS